MSEGHSWLPSMAHEAVVMKQRGLKDNCIALILEDINKVVSCLCSFPESLEKELHCKAIDLDCRLHVLE